MPDNLEEEFLDKDQILEEKKKEEKKEATEEVQEDEVIVARYDPKSEAYKCCHKALKRQTSLAFLWVLLLLAFLVTIAILYGTQQLNFSNSKKEAITVIPFASVATIGIIAKIVALFKQNFYYSSQKESYLTALPEKPNKVIQSFYLLQHCRKCSQYWITLTLVLLSIITPIYCVIVTAILYAAGDQNTSGLFKIDHKLGFGQDTVAGVAFLSLFTIPIWLLCYSFANSRTTKIITSLEATYEKEKIIDCALCNHKLEASNKRKKLIAFGIVCTLGFFIYFFFKRLTCTVFEKSFEV